MFSCFITKNGQPVGQIHDTEVVPYIGNVVNVVRVNSIVKIIKIIFIIIIRDNQNFTNKISNRINS